MHLAWSVRAYRPTGSLLFMGKSRRGPSGPAQQGKSRLGRGISIGHMHRYMRPLAGFCWAGPPFTHTSRRVEVNYFRPQLQRAITTVVILSGR